MTNTVRQIAYRLKSDGSADVQRDMAAVKAAGVDAYDGVAAATDRATAAADRAAKRNLALAQSGRDAYAAWGEQQKFNALLGVDRPVSAGARESAAIFEAEAEALDRAAAKAALLRAQIDPLGAAQARLNGELAEYAGLAKRGALSTEELAAAEALARKRFDETTLAIGRRGAGLSRLERASRLNLARQGADVAVTAAMGMNPGMIAIQQGPQILDALATSGIRASAVMLGLGGAVTVAGGAFAAAMAASEAYGRSLNETEAAADGLGRGAGMAGAEVAAMADEAGRAGEISSRAAREQAAAYLRTGVVGREVLDRLIAQGRDYQVTFGEDAAASTRRLAEAMADPARAAATWGVQIGGVDTATLRLIESMVRQNDLTGAQMVLLDAAGNRLLDHRDYVTQVQSAWDALVRSIGNAVDNVGRFIYVTDEEKIASLERSLPYAVGGEAIRDRKELARLTAERDARQKRLDDNAAAIRRASDDAASRTAYDRVFPQEARIRALRDDRVRFARDAEDPKKTAADQATARAAIAATDRQIGELEKKKDGAARASGRHAASLQRETDSLEANAQGARTAADAWLKSTSEGMKAEAARAAATRAARNGADAELRGRQQLAVVVAEQASAGAKAAAEMEEEAASRRRLNDAVAAGTMTVEEANQALETEGRLRPLTRALTLAEGEAKGTLQRVIEALTRSQASLNAETAREAILADTAGKRRTIALLETELALVRATDEARAVAIARRQAEQELDARKVPLDSAEGRDAVRAAEDEARARARLSRGDWAAQTVRGQEEALALAVEETALLRSRPTLRDQERARLALVLDLKRRLVGETSEEGREILANHDRLVLVERQLARAHAAWDRIEDTGSRAIDRFGDLLAQGEDDWNAWRAAGLNAIQDIVAEAIKLSLVNPFKNWLFGQNNPTWDDGGGVLGGFLGGLFGKGASSGGEAVPSWFNLRGFAGGTEGAPEGWSWVGEEGPELRYLPGGTKIRSTSSSMDMLRAAMAGGGEPPVTLHLGGISIDARGADPAAAARIEQSVEELRRTVPAIAVGAVREAMTRRRLRV